MSQAQTNLIAGGGQWIAGGGRQMAGGGVKRRTLLVYCQPIVSLCTDEVAFEELLVRMVGTQPGEVIAPAAFLPTMERRGRIGFVDRWMLRQAVDLAGEGRSVTVNIFGPIARRREHRQGA